VVQHAATDAGLELGDTIYDPFSGSGTTALTAASDGYVGKGAEVNPFLRFVAQTKVSKGHPERFSDAVEECLDAAKTGADCWLEEFSTFSSKAEKAKARGKWLFNGSVLKTFQGTWDHTKKLPKSEKALVRLCLIGGAMDAANAEKDGKCLRYKRNWKALRLGKDDFVDAVRARSKLVAEDLEVTSATPLNANIELGDSRRIAIDGSFDLCVTSPPYLNSFDYTDVYRPELFLGGFVSNMKQLRDLRQATLRSHVQASWKDPVQADFGKTYSDAIARLNEKVASLDANDAGLWDKRIPMMAQAYFEDMSTVLKSLRRKAKAGASLWLVVSTSAYAGVELPVDLIIADIGASNGWLLRDVHVLRHLRRVSCQQWNELRDRPDASGPHLRESLVVFDAAPRKRK
jgi:DNA modification methylase